MTQPVRVQVLMPPEDAGRFEAFCQDQGHKKSTLIARLIRDHLEREGYGRERAPQGRAR